MATPALVQSAFGRMVQIYDSKVRIKTGAKQKAEIGALVSALVTEAAKAPPKPATPGASPVTPGPATGSLTYEQVFERIGVALDDSWIVIPDTFLGIYSAANLPVKGRDAFLCSGVWASLGHSVGRGRRCILRLDPAATGDLRRRRLSHDGAGVVDHAPIRA